MIQWFCALSLLLEASAADVRGNPFFEVQRAIQRVNQHPGYTPRQPEFTRRTHAQPVRRQAPPQSVQPPEFVPFGKRQALPPPRVFYSLGAGNNQLDNVVAVLSTWGKQVSPDRIQIVGMKQTPRLWQGLRKAHMDKSALFVSADGCFDGHEGGACKDAIGLSRGSKSDADWVVLLGVDNYVLPKQLEAALEEMDPQEPYLLGLTGCSKPGCTPNKAPAVCGGGGQIFSRGALEILFRGGEKAYLDSVARFSPSCGMFGDLTNSRIAFTHGVHIQRVPGTVHPWKMTLSAMSAAVSKKTPPLVLHYLKPDEMYSLYASVPTTRLRGISLLSSTSSSLSDEERYVAEENKLRLASVGHVEFTLSNFSYELLKPM